MNGHDGTASPSMEAAQNKLEDIAKMKRSAESLTQLWQFTQNPQLKISLKRFLFFYWPKLDRQCRDCGKPTIRCYERELDDFWELISCTNCSFQKGRAGTIELQIAGWVS